MSIDENGVVVGKSNMEAQTGQDTNVEKCCNNSISP